MINIFISYYLNCYATETTPQFYQPNSTLYEMDAFDQLDPEHLAHIRDALATKHSVSREHIILMNFIELQ